MKRREELSSAMGPDEESGDAHPAPADEATGLGGVGTEGKPGPPEGGIEPQLPREAEDEIALTPEERRKLAERIAREDIRARRGMP